MELTVRGRGVRITEQLRARAEHKLAKLERLDPRADRIEIEVVPEGSARSNGTNRIEGAFFTPRHVVRATASAPDLEAALDLLAERLERQVRDYREKVAKRKKRLLQASNRLKSPRIRPEGRAEQP